MANSYAVLCGGKTLKGREQEEAVLKHYDALVNQAIQGHGWYGRNVLNDDLLHPLEDARAELRNANSDCRWMLYLGVQPQTKKREVTLKPLSGASIISLGKKTLAQAKALEATWLASDLVDETGKVKSGVNSLTSVAEDVQKKVWGGDKNLLVPPTWISPPEFLLYLLIGRYSEEAHGDEKIAIQNEVGESATEVRESRSEAMHKKKDERLISAVESAAKAKSSAMLEMASSIDRGNALVKVDVQRKSIEGKLENARFQLQMLAQERQLELQFVQGDRDASTEVMKSFAQQMKPFKDEINKLTEEGNRLDQVVEAIHVDASRPSVSASTTSLVVAPSSARQCLAPEVALTASAFRNAGKETLASARQTPTSGSGRETPTTGNGRETPTSGRQTPASGSGRETPTGNGRETPASNDSDPTMAAKKRGRPPASKPRRGSASSSSGAGISSKKGRASSVTETQQPPKAEAPNTSAQPADAPVTVSQSQLSQFLHWQQQQRQIGQGALMHTQMYSSGSASQTQPQSFTNGGYSSTTGSSQTHWDDDISFSGATRDLFSGALLDASPRIVPFSQQSPPSQQNSFSQVPPQNRQNGVV